MKKKVGKAARTRKALARLSEILKTKARTLVFWIALVALVIYIGREAYSDFGKERVNCKAPDSHASAFLVLNELQSSSKQIKASLLVPTLLNPAFKLDGDRLVLESATPDTNDPSVTRYETLLAYKPDQDGQSKFAWLAFSSPYSSADFFYPFENYEFNLHIDYQKNGNDVPLDLQVRNKINELILEPCSHHYSFTNAATDVNGFSVRLRRHRFVKATAAVLYSVAFVFLLHIARREDLSTVLSNSLGYMAALWGIREIIIGNSKLFPTIVDFVTLGLYIAVVAIVAYKWLFHRAPEKSES